ncbi:MAG: DUF507 domain-containing protein [Deltaproteobacteria bacterium]|nr:MAG: DUF507 domain-containing protein [Deltaproteobacteria bacterium]
MKLYPKQVSAIARDMVEKLVAAGDIEIDEGLEGETVKDFEAILNEYVRAENEVGNTARKLLQARGWPSSRYGEARRAAAEIRRVPLGEDAIAYVIEQILEFLMMSNRIAEVYSEDRIMRKRLAGIMRQHLRLHEELDAEVRKRLKNIQEGTRDWEIAYSRTMEQLRRAKGLT